MHIPTSAGSPSLQAALFGVSFLRASGCYGGRAGFLRGSGQRPFRAAALALVAVGVAITSGLEADADAADRPLARACREAAAPIFEDGPSFAALAPGPAVEACETAVQLAPGDGALRAFLARAHAKAENWGAMHTAIEAGIAANAPEAIWYQGVALEFGYGVQPDPEAAAAAYARAAEEHGYPGARHNLAVLYLEGRGVERDTARALAFFEAAAAQDHVSSLLALGDWHDGVHGATPDAERAFGYYVRAAELGSAQGQLRVGRAFETGRGVEPNVDRAAFWMEEAAGQGLVEAQLALIGLWDIVHRVTEERAHLQRLAAAIRRVLDGDHGRADAYLQALGVAETRYGLIDDEEALEARRTALVALEKSGHASEPSAIDLRSGVARAEFHRIKRSLRRREPSLRKPTPNETSRISEIFGALEAESLEPEAEIALLRELADHYVVSKGPDHPDTALVYGWIASAYERAGVPEKAKAFHERKAAILTPHYSEPLAFAERAARDAEEAGLTSEEYSALLTLEMIRGETGDIGALNAVKRRKWRLNPNDIDPFVRMPTNAELDRMSEIIGLRFKLDYGDPAEIALLQEYRAIEAATYGPNHPKTATTTGSLADALAAAGRDEQALETYRAQVTALTEVVGLDHKLTRAAISHAAQQMAATGDLAGGLALLTEISEALDQTVGRLAPESIEMRERLSDVLLTAGPADRHAAVATDLFDRHVLTAPAPGLHTARLLFEAHTALLSTGRVADAERFFDVAHAGAMERAASLSEPKALKDLGLYAGYLGVLPGYALIAEDAARLGVSVARGSYGDSHFATHRAIGTLASVLLSAHRREEARAVAEAATAALRVSAPRSRAHADALFTLLAAMPTPDPGLDRTTVVPEDADLAEDRLAIAGEILNVAEAENAPGSLEVVNARLNLAAELMIAYRAGEADALMSAIVADLKARPNHPLAGDVAEMEAAVAFQAGDPARSARLLDASFAGWDEGDATSPLTPTLRIRLLLALGRPAPALAIARASHAGLATIKDDVAANATQSEAVRRATDTTFAYIGYLLARTAFAQARTLPEDDPEQRALLEEAFEAAQPAAIAGASGSASRAAARRAAASAGAADAVARWESAVWTLDALRRAEAENARDALAARGAFRDAWQSALERRRAEASREVATAVTALASLAPDVLDPLGPATMTLRDLRESGALSEDEALILLAPGVDDGPGIVWAVSATDASWAEIPLEDQDLERMVSRLRVDVDVALRNFVPADGPVPAPADAMPTFDRGTAHELYRQIFGDAAIRRVIDTKRVWRIVAQESFLSLPFAALVTEEPAGADGDPEALRRTAWLGTERGLSLLTSVGAATRDRASAGSRPSRQFLGVGDPVFDSGPDRSDATATLLVGGIADGAKVSRLGRLPGTRREVTRVSEILGTGASDVLLGEDASETALKRRVLDGSLGEADVILFATHGLVSGDLGGLAEPALALTPLRTGPIVLDGDGTDEPTEGAAALRRAAAEGRWIDDGLLTASEIARLSLSADWVILSACDTATGSEPGAEGLSGLASGFFSAGAASLLVSHWPVEDEAAARTTTRLIDLVTGDPRASRPLALRQVMQELIEDTSDDLNAHPAIWAPFHLVEAK